MFIIFTLGYLLGGVTALVVLGLTVAARRGDGGAPHVSDVPVEETVTAWIQKR